MFGGRASPFFLDTSDIWWRRPLSLEAEEVSWDVTEMAALCKTADDSSDPSHLEGNSKEELAVPDPELEAIKAKLQEIEKEDEKLKELQLESESHLFMSSEAGLFPKTAKEKVEADQRSIYVGNNWVDSLGFVFPGLEHSLGVSDGGAVVVRCEWGQLGLLPPMMGCESQTHELEGPGLSLQVDYGGTAEELESHFNSCGQINRVTILCDKFSGHPKGYAYIEFEEKSSVKAAVELDESTFRGRVIKVLPKRTNMPGISTTDRGGYRGHYQGRWGGYYGGQHPRVRGRIYSAAETDLDLSYS
ncbi:poly(A) binding protein nuclear 1 like, cytoplasmic [Pitangus sulphuratus]|nr:poly(A) binding protein nuclear 1 like, cytoplasmic [Pitangus sulphuratus]